MRAHLAKVAAVDARGVQKLRELGRAEPDDLVGTLVHAASKGGDDLTVQKPRCRLDVLLEALGVGIAAHPAQEDITREGRGQTLDELGAEEVVEHPPAELGRVLRLLRAKVTLCAVDTQHSTLRLNRYHTRPTRLDRHAHGRGAHREHAGQVDEIVLAVGALVPLDVRRPHDAPPPHLVRRQLQALAEAVHQGGELSVVVVHRLPRCHTVNVCNISYAVRCFP